MNKTKRIDVKVMEEQFEALAKKAADFSMNLSEYMIFCGMNARISVEIGNFSALKTFSYEMDFVTRMWKNGEITEQERDRLKADLFKKHTKSAGQ